MMDDELWMMDNGWWIMVDEYGLWITSSWFHWIMTLNNYIRFTGVKNEQDLAQSLIDEHIKIHGVEFTPVGLSMRTSTKTFKD